MYSHTATWVPLMSYRIARGALVYGNMIYSIIYEFTWQQQYVKVVMKLWRQRIVRMENVETAAMGMAVHGMDLMEMNAIAMTNVVLSVELMMTSRMSHGM